MKEAKRWLKIKTSDFDIIRLDEAPELLPNILALIDRVNNIDETAIRLSIQPDHRLINPNRRTRKEGTGRKALKWIKKIGI